MAVMRCSTIMAILVVIAKMSFVWTDNTICASDDKAREALNRAIDESTRKRREVAEQHECVALVAEAFARATRVFLYTIGSLVAAAARTAGPYGVARAIRDLLMLQGSWWVWAKRQGSLRWQSVHSAPGDRKASGVFSTTTTLPDFLSPHKT